MEITRRLALGGLAAVPFMTASARVKTGWDVIVVGAGVFGAWTAENLRRSGKRVLLVDAWGPANARASSGGETRMTRGGYGTDKIYSAMALESLEEWKRLSSDTGTRLFHKTGVLAFFDKENDYAAGSLKTLQALDIPVARIEPATLAKRWPQINWSDVAFGLYEPEFGALMARRGVATLVQAYIKRGGAYRQTMILPPKAGEALTSLQTKDGDTLQADQYVFACGPWLAKLFPALLGDRLFATRQEIFYFRAPGGDRSFTAPSMPGWAHFASGKVFYGFPDIESRGFKIAEDTHGPLVDFDANDRLPTAESLGNIRAYMGQRFPGLADAPLSEARVCQYENSANGDFLIDKHPDWDNAVLVGMGSGHGFKHGPAVGKRAAALLLDGAHLEPRFSLATKATHKARAVH